MWAKQSFFKTKQQNQRRIIYLYILHTLSSSSKVVVLGFLAFTGPVLDKAFLVSSISHSSSSFTLAISLLSYTITNHSIKYIQLQIIGFIKSTSSQRKLRMIISIWMQIPFRRLNTWDELFFFFFFMLFKLLYHSFQDSNENRFWQKTNPPCMRWPRPTVPMSVREIIGRPYLTNGFFLPHLVNVFDDIVNPENLLFFTASIVIISRDRNESLENEIRQASFK